MESPKKRCTTKPIIHCGGFPKRKSVALLKGSGYGGKVPRTFSATYQAAIRNPVVSFTFSIPQNPQVTPRRKSGPTWQPMAKGTVTDI